MLFCHGINRVASLRRAVFCFLSSIIMEVAMVTATAVRVPEHTAEQINEKIRRETEKNLAYYSSLDREGIDRRLRELDREWEIERVLQRNASIAVLAGVALRLVGRRIGLLFPLVAGGFLLQQALTGWSPPIAMLRRLGFRTRHEIDQERHALKMLRGDYRDLPDKGKPVSEQINELLGIQEK